MLFETGGSKLRQEDLRSKVIANADHLISIELNGTLATGKPTDVAGMNKRIHYLLACYRLTNDSVCLNAVEALADQVYDRVLINPNNISFLDGTTGVAYAFLKIYEFTANQRHVERSSSLVLNAKQYYLNDSYVGDSLFSGRSGILLTLLALYDVTGECIYLELMDECIRKILANAYFIAEGLAWYNPLQLVMRPLASFGYGASGIGYAFRKMGAYFNHPAFEAVAGKAFGYVSRDCYDPKVKQWRDYRKDILDDADFQKHITNFERNNVAYFESPSFCHCMDHGTAGICLSQVSDKSILDGIAFPPTSQLSPAEALDIAHVYIELHSVYKQDQYLSGAEKILKILTPDKVARIDIGLLQASVLLGESCHYKFPRFTFRNAGQRPDFRFTSVEDAQRILFENRFKKTSACLHQLERKDVVAKEKNQLLLPAEYLESEVRALEISQDLASFVSNTFAYEKKLYDAKVAYKQNPLMHIRDFIAKNKNIESLNIEDSALVRKRLVVSAEAVFHKVYVPLKTLDQVPKVPKTYSVFWKFSLEEGIEEVPLSMIGFIVSRFNQPKSIETALLEVLLYCYFMKELKLEPLIKHSNSKSKKDLLKRLPFLFIYQVRLLVADGILAFDDSRDGKVNFQQAVLKRISKIIGIPVL